MDAETLEALKGSIKKWEDIVAGKGEDIGTTNCPLCKKYREPSCEKCPVKIKTEGMGCNESPYKAWAEHHEEMRAKFNNHGFPNKIECPECERLAKEELEFLKSLLPKEEFKVGDRVRVIGNSDGGDNEIRHFYYIGELVKINNIRALADGNVVADCENDRRTQCVMLKHLLKEAPMCDCKEKCENFKAKEKFKWEGEVRWDVVSGMLYPVSTNKQFQVSNEVSDNLVGKRTRITIEEV